MASNEEDPTFQSAASKNDDAVTYALSKFGIDINRLREGQRKSIDSFLEGNDTLVILPTGYGKSIVYQTAPFITDYLHHQRVCQCTSVAHIQQKSIAVVISPLVALMSNQVKKLQEKGISAINLASVKTQEEDTKLRDGLYSVVYATPESLLKAGTGLLSSPTYRNNVCGIFIDEGHCAAKWGYKHNKMAAFRKKYSRIAELRSFLKSSTPLFVLTATVSLTAKTVIINGTGLTNYNTVELSPERSNIRYSVVTSHAENVEGRFSWLAAELEKKRNQLPKVIVFCKLISNCSAIHMALSRNCKDLEKHIAIFHSVTHDNRKKEVLDDFVKEDGQIRILLCTSAFGMGVDIPNIHTVIHYGPSRDIDDYFQESGRVGRNGEQSHAILMNYKGRGKGTFNNDMKQYLSEHHQCRRQTLLKPYGYEPSASLAKHDCCDVCSKACECGQETCRESNGWAEKLFHEGDQGAKKTKTYKRNISRDHRDTVEGLLIKYQQSLVNDEDECRLYTGTSIASGLPLQVINSTVDGLHTIGDQIDLEDRFCFFKPAHTFKVWNIVGEICPPYVVFNSSESDTSDSETSESNASETSLRDFDSDCNDLCELIKDQYRRVTLPLSEESNDDD